ncbi:MAG: peptide/nickel transport system ATP-binding protein, partial [Caulobacteraceae bacterium]
MTEPLLQVRELCVEFPSEEGTVRAVDGASLSIGGGEALGLVGESGCGKSAAALSILRLIEPQGRIASGEVLFEGRDLAHIAPGELRRVRGNRIAMVFQEPMTCLNPVLTVGRQVEEAILAHESCPGLEARRRATELFERVGIQEARARLDSYPHQLSGGMRQRVMIAMALALKPALLIADEPTTALDATVQAQILALIAEKRRELGMALLLISHNLALVAQAVDRIAVMYAGQIVETAAAR